MTEHNVNLKRIREIDRLIEKHGEGKSLGEIREKLVTEQRNGTQ